MAAREPKAEHSKSAKQALLMQQQSKALPEGVIRRLPREIAAKFHANDLKEGYFFNQDESLKDKFER